MINRVHLVFAIVVPAFIASELNADDCSAKLDENINVCDIAQEKAKNMSELLPISVDPITTITSANADGKRVRITIKYGITKDDFKGMANYAGIPHEDYMKTFSNQARASTCTNQADRMFIVALGGEIEYVYLYRDGSIATTGLITKC